MRYQLRYIRKPRENLSPGAKDDNSARAATPTNWGVQLRCSAQMPVVLVFLLGTMS
jgi:hypothetical protein